MKNNILLYLLVLLPALLFSQEKNISLEFSNASQKKAIEIIEQNTSYRFYYKEQWFKKEVLISKKFENVSINNILDFVFNATTLNYYIDGNSILLSDNVLLSNAISENYFEANSTKKSSDEAEIAFVPIYNKQYMAQANKDTDSIITLGKQSVINTAPTHVLSGYVKNKITGKPEYNITIKVKDKDISTTTDANGFYSFRVPAGINTIEARSLNYDTNDKKIVLYNNGTVDFYISESVNALQEVVIDTKKTKNVASAVTGLTTINIENIKNVPLVLGEREIFKTSKTDENGRFVFLLDKQTIDSQAYIQLSELDKEDYTIVLDKEVGPDLSNLIFSNSTSISDKNLKAIQQRSLATQIENLYFIEKKDSVVARNDTAPFFNPIEKKYNLDNFDRFRTFKETVIEIVTELNFRVYNQAPALYLSDVRGFVNTNKEPCLVLVDGLQVQDLNALLNYNAYQIQSISVVPTAYYYGPKLFNGIVSVITKNNDFANSYPLKNILKTVIARPEPAKIYHQQKYEPVAKDNRIPDYRYQLLWKPNLVFDTSEISIPFYNSDVSGNYEIILEGITNSGKLIRIDKTFKVE